MEAARTFLLFLPVLLVSVVAHEYAHARVAVAQGDPTPDEAGRLTLNPLPHLDPIGSLLVPVLLWFSGAGFLIGWARPVPVDPRNYRDYRRGDLLVSAAGVATNFALALGCVAAVVVLTYLGGAAAGPVVGTLRRMARFGVLLNLLLGVFNLIPIPPLDGSHLVYHALPPELGRRYRSLGRFGFLFLLVLVFVPGLLSALLAPVYVLDGWAEALIRFLA